MASKITSTERRRRIDAFKSIVIRHPRLKTVRRRVLNLMDDSRALFARNQQSIDTYGNGAPLEHTYILPIIGPSGATKSKSIGEVVKHVLDTQKLGDQDVPILLVRSGRRRNRPDSCRRRSSKPMATTQRGS